MAIEEDKGEEEEEEEMYIMGVDEVFSLQPIFFSIDILLNKKKKNRKTKTL